MPAKAGDPRATQRWRNLRTAILRNDNICWLCGQPGADTIDHIVELAKGGDPYDLANLRPAHGRKRPGCPGNYGRSRRKQEPQHSRRW